MEISKVNQLSVETVSTDKVLIQNKIEAKTHNPFSSSDSTTLKKSSGVSSNPFEQNKINPIEAGELARKEVLNYFKNSFVGTDKYKQAFGDKKWDDIADSVIYRLQLHRDKNTEASNFQGNAYAFNIEINGVTGQVAIDKKSGSLKAINIDAE